MIIRLHLLTLPFLLLAGCPASPPPASQTPKLAAAPAPAAPCRGAALQLHALKDQCNTKRRQPAAQPDGLATSILPSPVKLKAGAEVPVTVRYKNTLASALEIIVDRGCGIYSSSIVDDKDQPVDLEGIAPLVGGLCASRPPVKVTLEPGGHLDMEVLVSGLKQRWVAQGNAFVIEPGGPIPPGSYTLKLQSPYVEFGGEEGDVPTTRWISAPLVITE